MVWTDRAHSGHLLTNSIAAALPTYGVDGPRTQRSLTDKLHCCGAAHLWCGRTAHTAVTYCKIAASLIHYSHCFSLYGQRDARPISLCTTPRKVVLSPGPVLQLCPYGHLPSHNSISTVNPTPPPPFPQFTSKLTPYCPTCQLSTVQ